MITEARSILNRHISEGDLQRSITDLADAIHLPWFHDEDARRDNAGFPDLVIPAWDTLLMLELKAMGGRLRDGQRAWGSALARCTKVEYRVVRPDDWEWVEAKLRGGN